MNITGTILLFLPFVTCLFWLILNALVHKRNDAFRALETVLGIVAFTSLAEAGLWADIAGLFFIPARQFTALLIIPVSMVYTDMLSATAKTRLHPQIWVSAPISLLFTETILIMLDGADSFQSKTMMVCSFEVFYGLMAIELILWISEVTRKLRNGYRHIQLYNCSAIIAIYAILQIAFNVNAEVWVIYLLFILLSGALFITAYSGLFHGRPDLRYRDLTGPNAGIIPAAYEWSPSATAPVQKEMRKSRPVQYPAGLNDPSPDSADDMMLRSRFEDVILSERLYLRQGIRISDIAAILDTNRTYISRLVNNTYNMSFSEYINSLRIEYAKHYLQSHADARQTDIASDCGFPNASAFNNIFKKITGVTPKIWLATNSQNETK